MGVEIERKFLVTGDSWRDDVIEATRIMQGYLSDGDTATVRVRVKGERGFITIKGRSQGVSRSEFEYEIPVADASAMLAELARGPVIDKVRHIVEVGGHRWEVDVFAGDNEGLVMAELELSDESEQFQLPDWAAQEVSDDPRYYNVNLARSPYRTWGL
jgi:adenylate cyclase